MVTQSGLAFTQVAPETPAPEIVRQLLHDASMLLSDTTRWSSYARGDGRTLWIGTAFVRPVERSRTVFVIVDSVGTPRAWVIGTFSGFDSYDKHQVLLVNQGDLLVFDQYDIDYGWTRQRFVFWFDLPRGTTIASRELRQAPRLGWGRRGSAIVPMMLGASGWVVARGGEVDVGGAAGNGGDSLALLVPDTTAPSAPGVSRDSASRWVLGGTPTILLQDGPTALESPTTTGPGRIGQVTGADTAWTAIPLPSDSLREAAWTYEGMTQDYEFNESYGPPVRAGDRVFAGIGFEGGEGWNGVGGLLEYSIRGRSVVIHRWPEIVHSSAGTPVVDRDSLWLPLYHNGEYGTYGGGVLVVALSSNTARLVGFPDPARRLERAGGRLLIGGGTSLGLLTGAHLVRWIVVPDARGEWTAVEAAIR